MSLRIFLAGLAVLVLSGCAGMRIGSLPTDEERCVGVGGVFHAGLCEYCR
jgi:hypothetical protein